MKATEKQVNCIEIIRNKINYSDDCVPSIKDRKMRNECIKDYFKIYESMKNNVLTKPDASKFIGKWLQFSKDIRVKVSGYGLGRNDGRDSDNYDVFPIDMYY
ncbi:MAG: hypothetical protein ACRDDY_17010 [Clostridium sp.]|uniref:hypothetical protein n=1 Tax=Clostridium sp. TaxID=1506 RepID=UPI003EE75892